MIEHPDATWLFAGRDPLVTDKRSMLREGQHSEHWWTALFSILLLHLASQPTPPKIALRRHIPLEPRFQYPETGSLDYHGMSLSSILVEARLLEAVALKLFNISEWPLDFQTLEVDLAISLPERNRVILIENKTERSRTNSLDRYEQAVKYLRGFGKNADLYVLISGGHWNDEIWGAIARNNLEIILWEDVLRLLHAIPLFRDVFHNDLPAYFAAYP
ncbi:MAG: hypothetical protein KF814_10935 [Nitrospiraceae bacterium]|nr:hypothetical protein [Nitrospiraceae bacterium]